MDPLQIDVYEYDCLNTFMMSATYSQICFKFYQYNYNIQVS